MSGRTSNFLLLACGCRSSGRALVLLAAFDPGVSWLGLFLFSFLFGRPHFGRYLRRCSWTLVPCIRSHESAGHMVVYVLTGQMVGDHRSPNGRQYWGARLSTSSANHRFQSRRQVAYIVTPCGRCTAGPPVPHGFDVAACAVRESERQYARGKCLLKRS